MQESHATKGLYLAIKDNLLILSTFTYNEMSVFVSQEQ